MAEQWIIRVAGKEYGPADLDLLREWQAEGRVLRTNEARRVDEEQWRMAADIGGLFEIAAPPVQNSDAVEPLDARRATRETAEPRSANAAPRQRVQLFRQTFAIYFRGFWQFFALTVLAIGPTICGRFTGALVESAPNVDGDLRTLVAAAVSFCMFVLSIVLWPIYLAGIQILTAEFASRRRMGFLQTLNEAVVYWPRIMGLCIVVYGAFSLLMLLALAIAALIAGSPGSPAVILIALFLLAFQVWAFGRVYIRVLFWQQCAVLEGAGVVESLRRSSEIARSGKKDLPWFRRPAWRGVVVASLWFIVVCAVNWPALWPQLKLLAAAGTTDPQALLQSMQAAAKTATASTASFVGSIAQAILRPLLGIAFVLVYFDGTSRDERD